MAVAGADGSIILSTKVDTTGVNKGMASMKSGIKSLANDFVKLGSTIAAVFSLRTLYTFSKESSNVATTTKASVQRLIDIYGEASESIGNFIDTNARALGMSKSAAAQFSSVYGNLFSVWADQDTNAELTARYLNATAVVASKTGRTVEDVQERIRSGLLGNTEAIEDLGIFVNIKTIEMTDAFKRMAGEKSWEQLDAYSQQQIRTMAILEQATEKYGAEVAQTEAMIKAQNRAAYEDFKNTWGQVVNVVLMPILRTATQIFNVMTKGLQVIAGMTGKTIETSNEQSSSIANSVENQEDLTKAVKETEKEQKKALAGFDEINILTESSKEEQSNVTPADMLATSGGAGLNAGIQEQTNEIESGLALIMGIAGEALVAVGLILLFTGNILWGIGFIIAGAALLGVAMAAVAESDVGEKVIGILTTIMAVAGGALVAIGIMLIMLGSTAVGVGFVIAGAALLIGAVAALVAFDVASVQNVLTLIMGIAGGALLALGIMLCIFAGPSPIAIGLIIAGAVSLVAAVALRFDAVIEALKGPIGAIVALVSSVLLVIGIILCCCGVALPLGIGLIAAGAVGLAATVALNWNFIFDTVSTFFKDSAGLVVGISLALLVLGIILCCTGVALPLGIGLIVAGAVGLATEVALNWNYITESITTFFQDNAGLIVGVSLALIVIGIILLFTGVGIPLALGLIIAGGGLLATEVALNWNFITDKIKEVWENIKAFWNENIAPIFTAEWWLELAKNAANGLIEGFESAINGIIAMFENMINWIVTGLNSISFEVPDWVPGIGGSTFGFNIPEVKFERISIPRLAQGAVIPPNREFLAVLGDQKSGTNIEAPLTTIKQAVAEVVGSMGGGGNQTVVLELDGRELGRTNIAQNSKEYSRLGVSLLK